MKVQTIRTAPATLLAESGAAIVVRLDGEPSRKVDGVARDVVVYCGPYTARGRIVASLRALADRVEAAT